MRWVSEPIHKIVIRRQIGRKSKPQRTINYASAKMLHEEAIELLVAEAVVPSRWNNPYSFESLLYCNNDVRIYQIYPSELEGWRQKIARAMVS